MYWKSNVFGYICSRRLGWTEPTPPWAPLGPTKIPHWSLYCKIDPFWKIQVVTFRTTNMHVSECKDGTGSPVEAGSPITLSCSGIMVDLHLFWKSLAWSSVRAGQAPAVIRTLENGRVMRAPLPTYGWRCVGTCGHVMGQNMFEFLPTHIHWDILCVNQGIAYGWEDQRQDSWNVTIWHTNHPASSPVQPNGPSDEKGTPKARVSGKVSAMPGELERTVELAPGIPHRRKHVGISNHWLLIQYVMQIYCEYPIVVFLTW